MAHLWSENAKLVLSERYLLRNTEGEVAESPDELIKRVSGAIAGVEESGKLEREWEEKFYRLMSDGAFLPNSPTLMNAGKQGGQLSACFVLPVADDLEGIFDSLKYAALIHQSGGGTGFSFSRLRERGAEVGSSGGVAGGPMAFLNIFDQATEAIKQGGVRRGANMGVLSVEHPDIFDFIESKRDFKSITNFNLSVGVTARFMRALRSGGDHELISPQSGRVVRKVRAREVFDRIVASAWACGDPGILFLDRMNLFNPTPQRGAFEATNPCGEQPLLGFESCNLGSLNLARFVQQEGVDWTGLGQAVEVAVRFLDNVIEANAYPLPECRDITRRNRKIGLGVMGFADLLLWIGVAYGSDRSFELGERIMSFIDRSAKAASARLAKERGPMIGFKQSLWASLGYPPLRHATVSTVAPTGTISLLAGASSGIEPHFAANLQRNVLGGKRLIELQPGVARALRKWANLEGSISESDVTKRLGELWRPAHLLSPEAHLRMQAAFQRHSDSAVSKTVNLPSTAKEADVAHAYLRAYELGCKGITVYRDRSRPGQVLEQATSAEACDLCVD